MATVLLLHSILGRRPAEAAIADALRLRGHRVEVPDLYDGASTDRYEDGFRIRDAIGEPTLAARALASVEALPPDTVLAGVSYGAFLLGEIWGRRPQARGVVLIAGVAPWMTPVRERLRVSAHVARPDPFDSEPFFEDWVRRSAPARVDLHRYDGAGHYFLDPALPDHDPVAADLCLGRIIYFVAEVAAGP